MISVDRCYIDGAWAPLHGKREGHVHNPATGAHIATITYGDTIDVDRAVAAARRAFEQWSVAPLEVRLDLLDRIIACYDRRAEDLAQAVCSEMGSPITLARQAHVPSGLKHLRAARKALAAFAFDKMINATMIVHEPIGVCALITPWNWPLNQIACKVGPALAAGCTVVLKPSEVSPLSAMIFAEIIDEASTPAGIFNLVNGDGPGLGEAMSGHQDVDMISFTGSTRAGIAVAKSASDTVKRVTQELGGKSPSIVFDDEAFAIAVAATAKSCFQNSGQSCNAPTRLLVPRHRQGEAEAIVKDCAKALVIGDPRDVATTLGPVANAAQFEKIQRLIQNGIEEGGARLVDGGTGLPAEITQGAFVRPTVFADVTSVMTIAREEIFGPVLAIMPYDTDEEAIAIANDSEYGLSAYVWAADPNRSRKTARQLRAGMVHVDGARSDPDGAFGGYKRSGNGREWGEFGLMDFLEVKSIFGFQR